MLVALTLIEKTGPISGFFPPLKFETLFSHQPEECFYQLILEPNFFV